jgi:hypothetical protein
MNLSLQKSMEQLEVSGKIKSNFVARTLLQVHTCKDIVE